MTMLIMHKQTASALSILWQFICNLDFLILLSDDQLPQLSNHAFQGSFARLMMVIMIMIRMITMILIIMTMMLRTPLMMIMMVMMIMIMMLIMIMIMMSINESFQIGGCRYSFR